MMDVQVWFYLKDSLHQVQLGKAKKLISGLHEDLMWDYELKMQEFE